MKIELRKIVVKILILVALSMLVAFCTNLYAVQVETGWQSDSEGLVWGRVTNAVKNGLAADGGFLGAFPYQWEMTLENAVNKNTSGKFGVYRQQCGLQGTMCALFVMAAKNIGIEVYHAQRMLWIITAGLLIFVMILLAKWVKIEMGGGISNRCSYLLGVFFMDAT